MGQRFVIFDVDGTLCNTSLLDERLFHEVASKLLEAAVEPSGWEAAPHITDAGLVDWLWKRHRGRPPTRPEVGRFINEFEAALQAELQCAPSRFHEILGARRLVERLRVHGWEFAFATGGWERTARLKLQAAGLSPAPLLASSDDSPDRSAIFSLAYKRAVPENARGHNEVVLVGDGVWDVRVASCLGWCFLGVGCGEREAGLRREGATLVVPDFSDCDRVLDLIRVCRVPGMHGRPPSARRIPG
jgi:phosphoglycolate phosphatase-like HAD superfamily hydrolase